MGVTDPVLVKLVDEFAAVQHQKKQMAFTARENLPQAQLMNQQLEDARSALRENVKSAISQLKISLNNVNGRIAGVEKELGRLPGTERRLIGIQRKFDLNNSVYTYLLERRAEAGIAKASQITDNRIIDDAIVQNSSRVKPKEMKNYLTALMLGLLVPMVLIVIFDLMNNKIIGKHDIERLTRTPIIGYISHSDYRVEDPVAEKPGSTLAESFRAVRTSLAFYSGQKKCPVIIISSPISGEGKTFVSVNLATIISMMNKKVLIVGLDLRKPRVHAILNAGNGHGMSQYLSGNATFEEVIVPTKIENLWFAPSGPVPPNPAELIGSPKMTEFITRAREEFDTIIVDTPPVGIVTDALLLSQLSDVNLFVVRQRYTTRGSVQLLDEIYRKGEMSNVAILVNDISVSGYYGYGLRYGYSLGYGHRYYDPGNYYTKSGSRNSAYYTND
jgi:capsular exopolysaccharide synthesis family protein